MRKTFIGMCAALAVGIVSLANVAKAQLVDVPDHHWARDAVMKLHEAGIIEGYPDGTFKGERPMTRYEYAMVVERLAKWVEDYHNKNLPKAAEAKASSFDPKQIDEILAIIDKLKEEFRDELAALKLEVEQLKGRVTRIEQSAGGLNNIKISGNLRQRIDMLNSDLTNAKLAATFARIYPELGAVANDFDPGYELVPAVNIEANGGPGVTYKLGLAAYIQNQGSLAHEERNAAATDDSLVLQYAYADLDFSKSAKELDSLGLRVGYQGIAYGEYGLILDNGYHTSNPALRLDLSKDAVSISAVTGLTSGFTCGSGLTGIGCGGANTKDVFAAGRIGVDLDAFDFGVNFLGNGMAQEQAWGLDLNLPLLNNSDFLKNVRGEYVQMQDLQSGASVPAGTDEESYIVGLDVYKTSNTSLEFSYAQTSTIVPGMTSVDHNPFTEYDAWGAGAYASIDGGKVMFPDDFKGVGVKASHRILGDTVVSAKAWAGDVNSCTVGDCGYPGVGAIEVLKPINDQTAFRVEYMQQGLDDVILNRVRGELMLNF